MPGGSFGAARVCAQAWPAKRWAWAGSARRLFEQECSGCRHRHDTNAMSLLAIVGVLCKKNCKTILPPKRYTKNPQNGWRVVVRVFCKFFFCCKNPFSNLQIPSNSHFNSTSSNNLLSSLLIFLISTSQTNYTKSRSRSRLKKFKIKIQYSQQNSLNFQDQDHDSNNISKALLFLHMSNFISQFLKQKSLLQLARLRYTFIF